ncbi:MAG: c(7)-type cytochrome triheme domain-containing protein [Candidatus Electronema sp. VV]
MNKKLGMEAKSLISRGVLALGLVACTPALAEQQQAVAAKAAMPTSDVSRFSHDFHVNKVGFNCVDCHNSLFQQTGGSAKAAGNFTMSAFDQGKYCGTCHDGSTAFAATDQDSCARCHNSDVTGKKQKKPGGQ